MNSIFNHIKWSISCYILAFHSWPFTHHQCCFAESLTIEMKMKLKIEAEQCVHVCFGWCMWSIYFNIRFCLLPLYSVHDDQTYKNIYEGECKLWIAWIKMPIVAEKKAGIRSLIHSFSQSEEYVYSLSVFACVCLCRKTFEEAVHSCQ